MDLLFHLQPHFQQYFDGSVMRGNNPLRNAQTEAAAVHRLAVRRVAAEKTGRTRAAKFPAECPRRYWRW
jgi:hypothetical protein